MPLASDRQVNKKPFKIGMKSQNSARFNPLSWEMIENLLSRVHQNVAVVALANKLARICWAVLRSGQKFATKGAPLAV
jgi:hypothetical protein